MIEEGVSDEIVLRLVVSADENDGKSPAFLGPISVCRSVGTMIREVSSYVVPSPKMTVKPKLGLLRKIRQHGLDANLDRLLLIVEIAATMEIVLVNHWSPIEAFRPQNEVKSLANGGLPDVVAADEECMPR